MKSLRFARLPLAVAALALGSSVSSAQFSPEAFLPKDCQSNAVSAAAQTMASPILIAIGTMNVGGSTQTGLDVTTGKAAVWGYIFYTATGDSTEMFPRVRFLNNCADPSAFFPELANVVLPVGELGKSSLPQGYRQGTDLVSKLNENQTFTSYRAAYPDSQPSVAVLAISTIETMGYPAGTPYWLLTWTRSASGASPEVPGMTCFVHATTGETVCTQGATSSVADQATAAGFLVAPNPAQSMVMLSIPASLEGTWCTVEAVSALGHPVTLWQGVSTAPVLPLDVTGLANGAYSFRVSSATTIAAIPFCITR